MFKKVVSNISSTLGISVNNIKQIIKDMDQYLEAEANSVKSSQSCIFALRSYVINEAQSLENNINTIASIFEGVEEARNEKTEQLKENVIGRLDQLLTYYNARQTIIKEAEAAKKGLEKANTKLEKLRGKPMMKLKPGQIESADMKLKEAERRHLEKQGDLKVVNEEFTKNQLASIQGVLDYLWGVEKNFYDKASSLFNVTSQSAAPPAPAPAPNVGSQNNVDPQAKQDWNKPSP